MKSSIWILKTICKYSSINFQMKFTLDFTKFFTIFKSKIFFFSRSGVIQLSNELSRFTVNCVTNGDLERPMKIQVFLQEVLEGFRLLNLKNDNLRKKFDSIKYDMKKVEEVVYDLSIRGLVKPLDNETTGNGSSTNTADDEVAKKEES